MTAAPTYQGTSPGAIRHHYDAGNEFYRLFLDPSLTYSCALWTDEADTLEQAQRRKIDFHVEQARAAGAGAVLEVGCGWGSVLRRLVGEHRVARAVGLTLSDAQATWVRAAADERIEVRLENWFDHEPAAPYDAVISVGAFEHFARPGIDPRSKVDSYRRFFTSCHRWLRPDGHISLQTISYENTRRGEGSPFIHGEIFPEADVPRLADIAEAVEGRFEIVALRAERDQYERTCRAWLANLRRLRPEAVALVGEDQVARYEKYFKLCIVGFRIARVNLLRLTLRRLDRSFWSFAGPAGVASAAG
jgi:cyclopropane-fatty-acyl-phospholipid synthase